jgi:AcrR family transcriptional regulator
MPRSAAKARRDASEERVRERILAAFSARARKVGIRAVLMGELASELRMSAMTLYKHFDSKERLVDAMVDAWALELAAIDALDWDRARSCASALEVLLSWADAWTASLSQVSPALFADLHRDHPEAWARFHAVIDERKAVAARHLEPFVRDDLEPDVVFPMLDLLVTQAANPRFVETLGVSRRDAVRAAISLWGGGALRQRARLRALRPAAPRQP